MNQDTKALIPTIFLICLILLGLYLKNGWIVIASLITMFVILVVGGIKLSWLMFKSAVKTKKRKTK